MFIAGVLYQRRRGLAVEPGDEHVGQQYAAKLGIDGDGERG
jgi:hypothetical protein